MIFVREELIHITIPLPDKPHIAARINCRHSSLTAVFLSKVLSLLNNVQQQKQMTVSASTNGAHSRRSEMFTLITGSKLCHWRSCFVCMSDHFGKVTKAYPMPCLEVENVAPEASSLIDANFLDGAAVVQMLNPGTSKTFLDYAEQVFVPICISTARKYHSC